MINSMLYERGKNSCHQRKIMIDVGHMDKLKSYYDWCNKMGLVCRRSYV